MMLGDCNHRLGYQPLSKAETWKPWSYEDQVAGYSTKFNIDTGKGNQFAFLTVHKAGHEVPTYVPEQVRKYPLQTGGFLLRLALCVGAGHVPEVPGRILVCLIDR